jgi:NAD+ synthase
MIASAIEEGFNIRHRTRRKVLEEYAQFYNLLLIGCANRSESFVGWFVKDGVDDLPIETILGLYKNQVRQLARYLGVPPEILEEAPSPDMFKQIGDEDVIGYPYGKIDKVAYVVENDLDPQLAFDEGVTPEELEEIKKIHTLSEWKRENPHEYPIFDRIEVGAGLT